MTQWAHGASAYRNKQYSCRCDVCTKAHRERQLAENKARAARLQADPTLAPHGNANTYRNWSCRCQACVEVHAAQCRAYHKAKAAS